jgi:calpain
MNQFYREKLPTWAENIGSIEWRRPHEISKEARFMDKDSEFEVKQGIFAESWFLGALSSVTSKQELLQRLIVSSDYFERGFVTFQFFKNGKWVQVTVDTILPYERESNNRTSVYSSCANPAEFWVQLMEKAYAKLHGCYQFICEGNIAEGLVDLTGGVSEVQSLEHGEDTKRQDHMNAVWHNLLHYFNQKFLLTCLNEVAGKSAKSAEAGHNGILENHFYPIMDIRELAKEQLKLIRIRNPYGNEGVWTGPFSEDSEDWDKHRNLKEELKLSNKMSKKQDASWWMSFSDWLSNYNVIQIAKIFPESWENYSIEGRWQGKTYGGPCPLPADRSPELESSKKVKIEVKKGFKDTQRLSRHKPTHEQADTDDRWFNNPQYRVKVTKDTKLYISLMLEDEKLSKQPYLQTNFMIITNRHGKNRVWERPAFEDIVAEGNPGGLIPAQREVTTFIVLKKFAGKKDGHYIIIPNLLEINKEIKKEDKRLYFLRLFASEPIDVVELPETLEHTEDGAWGEDSSGGRRRMLDEKDKLYKDNPGWCRNPQYFVNLDKPTHVKIILRKTGQLKRLRNIKPGMTICRFETQIMPVISTKAKALQDRDSKKIDNLERLIKQTTQQLKPPVMEGIERKLYITSQEKFKESQYALEDYSALYFFWNPTEGPFTIIPSLEQEKNATFRLTFFSNNPIIVQKLDESRNAVAVGKWEQDISGGGCHLKKDWLINPKYVLTFADSEGTADLKIKLMIADKNWKKVNANTVKGMIGIYLLRRKEGKITYEDVIEQTNFLPVRLTELTLNGVLGVTMPICKEGYIIMPCTYEEKIHGSFILSVSSDKPISLTK